MVRWTEGEDSYLLRVSKAEEVFACLCIAALLLTAAVGVVVVQPSLFLCPAAPIAFIALVAAFIGYLRWEFRGWVEVPLRGGPVRWGYPGQDPSPPLDVARFEIEIVGEWGVFSRPHHHVVAVTTQGERVRVLGFWETVDAVRVQSIVSQLNQVLVARPPTP